MFMPPHSSGMPRRLPKYVQAFVDRRNNQPRHYFRRKGYPLTALPGLPYTPEFMSAYGNALASSEELIKKAKGERPARSVQPVAKVVPEPIVTSWASLRVMSRLSW